MSGLIVEMMEAASTVMAAADAVAASAASEMQREAKLLFAILLSSQADSEAGWITPATT